jgi:hypothetical protein
MIFLGGEFFPFFPKKNKNQKKISCKFPAYEKKNQQKMKKKIIVIT